MGPIFSDQVCYALYSTSHTVTQAYAALLKPLGLTYPQFVVMMALWQRDAVSVTTLAAEIGISKATLTPMLKKLEQAGYIQRLQDPDNERKKSLLLTRKGRDSAAEGEAIARAALCATGLTDSEAKQLIALCNKIKSNLK